MRREYSVNLGNSRTIKFVMTGSGVRAPLAAPFLANMSTDRAANARGLRDSSHITVLGAPLFSPASKPLKPYPGETSHAQIRFDRRDGSGLRFRPGCRIARPDAG